MTKEMKRPISDITQDSIKPLLSNAVEFYTNKNREAHKCIQERDEYINYLESKLSNAKPQQALPVVPERVADYISELKEKGHGITFGLMCSTHDATGEGNEKAIHWKDDNAETFARAWLDGYTVEKPQLFRLKLKNAPISNYYLWLNQATGKVFVDKKFLDWTNHDNVKNIFTEQEIAKISDGAFVNNEAFELVPVEDGE